MKSLKLFFVTIIVLTTALFAVACNAPISIPENKEDAIIKLETAGYSVKELETEEDGIIDMITAYKQDGDSYAGLMAIWFEDEDSAILYEESWTDSRYQVKKRYSNLVIYGTKQGVKDFEKG